MPIRTLPLPAALVLVLVCAASGAARSLDDFGWCLSRSGAVFYGASWCPVCRRQIETLGAAMRRVRYVECADASEPKRTTSACAAAHVTSYPTWVFGNGTRVEGGLSLASLAQRSGCALPDGPQPAPPPDRAPAAPPPPGSHGPHVQIIEVPQR